MGISAFAQVTPVTQNSRFSSPLILPRRCFPRFSNEGIRAPRALIGEKTLGVDYGLRRVGLAVSVGVAPRPLPRLEHRNSPRDAALGVASAARSTLSTTILVGYPVDIYGKAGEQAAETKIFLRELVEAAPWAKILYLDERFTSQDAREELRRAGVKKNDVKHLIDSASAVVLLDRFFSDGDEINAVEVHCPPVEQTEIQNETVERVSFAEWKKQAMEKAKRTAEDSSTVRRR